MTVEASTTVEMQGYGAATNPPFCGFGCVRRTMMNGVTQYWPLVLPKVKFALPGDDIATQEDQIDWQTQELEMTLFRDDTAGLFPSCGQPLSAVHPYRFLSAPALPVSGFHLLQWNPEPLS